MKKLRRMALVLGLCLFLIPAISQAQLNKLEDVRQDIVFPQLTFEEKRVIAEQAQILLRDLYVHRYQKIDYYGNEDPVQLIEEVVNNIDDLSTAEMEEKIYRIFIAQRDSHLNYYFPSPYRNYRSFLPLTFRRTAGEDNFFEVRVVSVNEERFRQFAPGQRIPSIGDEVVAYNGLPILDAVERHLSTSYGANEYGGFFRVLAKLTYRSHRRFLVPENNEVTIALKPYRSDDDDDDDYDDYDDDDDDVYTITLPWIAEGPERVGILQRLEEKEEYDPKRFDDLGIDDWFEEYMQFLKRHDLEPKSAYPSNPSNERVLTWGIIENEYGKFGYLRLSSMRPDKGVAFTVEEIRRIIIEEFGDTKGLIFDVRSNGGGWITLGDRLSQFFMPAEAEVLQSRLLNTDLNWRFFNETTYGASRPEWREVINEAHGTGSTYTGLSYFTTDETANTFGQVYYKPVAVLPDARSYSTTDMFCVSMQDNKAGLIYGEDPLTGAGGANVVSQSWLRRYMPDVFEDLPGDHYMRVSWRQNVRFGPHEGQLVEDYGCEADIDVSLTAYDLVSGNEKQIRTITKSLAKRSKKYTSSGRGEQNSHELYLSRDNLGYGFYVVETEYVQLLINGELYQELPVFAGRNEKFVEIEFPQNLPAGEVTYVTFLGVDEENKPLWNFKREVVVIDEKIVLDADGFEIDFSTVDNISPVTVVNQNPPEDGWNLVKPYLQIGYDPVYANYLDTDAIVFLDLRQRTSAQLSFGMEFDTELNWDFIEVSVTNNNEKVVLLRESGYQALTTYEYDLSSFAGQDNIALHFRFTSDSNTVEQGVRLSNISVR